jgi:universal stress protein A
MKPNKSAQKPEALFRSVLVPMDFSGKSRQALAYALPLARQAGARISLLHVLQPAHIYPAPLAMEAGLIEHDLRTHKRDAARHLDKLAADLIPEDLRGRSLIGIGHPGQLITDTAKRQRIGLIVMSAKGRTGLSRLLLGSTAEFVVRHANCPVLTVRRR